MTGRIFTKLFGAFLVVVLIATLAIDVAIRKAWEDSLFDQIHSGLEQEARALAVTVEHERNRPLQQVAQEFGDAVDARVTIIDSNGKVLADTRANRDEMENHATRPEFIAALHGKPGSSTRLSHTVGVAFHYVAVPIPGGAVRLAYPLDSIQRSTSRVRRNLLGASAVALLLAALLALVAAELIARRLRRIMTFANNIAAGDLGARVEESSGDEIAQLAAALDQTARKLESSFAELETSHRQLEAVLNSMPDPLFVVSRDKRVRWANDPVRRLARAGTGVALIDAFRDPALLEAVESSLAGSSVSHARAALSGRNYEVFSGPMPGGGAVVVLHDVSDIERVEKTRRDFIANVSHELRTPLTSIQGWTETLLDTEDRATTREFLEIIRKNAIRMARLTEDLLILARVESGEQRFAIQPVTVKALLDDATETFRNIAGASGVRFRVRDLAQTGSHDGHEGSATATKEVLADADAIHQVFTNLLDNAIKYGGSGGEIEVGAREHEAGVEFYIRDSGPGIASEHIPRLFERFYRVDKGRSREAGGTGLGLAIVKHIVRAHGGSIHAESEFGHGATFSFVLPAVPVASQQSPVASTGD
ncbi:MAG: ATP-binding protein [Terriglobales bacterium]